MKLLATVKWKNAFEMSPFRAYLAALSYAQYTRPGGIFLPIANSIAHPTSLILGLEKEVRYERENDK